MATDPQRALAVLEAFKEWLSETHGVSVDTAEPFEYADLFAAFSAGAARGYSSAMAEVAAAIAQEPSEREIQ